jgi:hypothetical protein
MPEIIQVLPSLFDPIRFQRQKAAAEIYDLRQKPMISGIRPPIVLFSGGSGGAIPPRYSTLYRVHDAQRVIKQYFPLDSLVFVLIGKSSEIESVAKKYVPKIETRSFSQTGF